MLSRRRVTTQCFENRSAPRHVLVNGSRDRCASEQQTQGNLLLDNAVAHVRSFQSCYKRVFSEPCFGNSEHLVPTNSPNRCNNDDERMKRGETCAWQNVSRKESRWTSGDLRRKERRAEVVSLQTR